MKLELAKELAGAGRVFVVSHYDPDGDALGSSLGLAHALVAAGKQVFVHSAGPIAANYRFLPGMDMVSQELPDASWPQACVLLDCHEPERTGPAAAGFLRGRQDGLIIDHHQGAPDFGRVRWVETTYAATAEMVLDLLDPAGLPLDLQTATCLFVGLQTDTGSFRYSNTGPAQFAAAARLARAGVDVWGASQEVYATTRVKLELLAKVVGSLSMSADGRVAVAQVSLAELDELGAAPSDLENMVEDLRAIRGVEAAALVREMKDGRSKASLRSKGKINVAEIAIALGGGGHRNAAGLKMSRPLAEAAVELAGRLTAALERVR